MRRVAEVPSALAVVSVKAAGVVAAVVVVAAAVSPSSPVELVGKVADGTVAAVVAAAVVFPCP